MTILLRHIAGYWVLCWGGRILVQWHLILCILYFIDTGGMLMLHRYWFANTEVPLRSTPDAGRCITFRFNLADINLIF